MTRAEKAERIQKILAKLYPLPPIPLQHEDPYTLLAGRRAVRPVHRRPREPGDAAPLRPRAHARCHGTARRARHPGDHQIVWTGARQGAAHPRAVADPRRAPRGRRPGRLRGARGLARRRPQDGERRDGAGLRPAGLPRGHPYPPAGRAVGALDGAERDGDRARPEGALRAGRLEHAASADDLLRARALPGARPRPRRMRDLLVVGVQGPGRPRAGTRGAGRPAARPPDGARSQAPRRPTRRAR